MKTAIRKMTMVEKKTIEYETLKLIPTSHLSRMTKKEVKLLVWLKSGGYNAFYNEWFKCVTVLDTENEADWILGILRHHGFTGSHYDLTGKEYSHGEKQKQIRVYAKTGTEPVKTETVYRPINALVYEFTL